MSPDGFLRAVSSLQFDNCFNPYVDRCEVHDHEEAPHLRASALSDILAIASSGPIDAIWLGRDLGYRGGRRTGMALTDDLHVHQHARRWNLIAERPTIGAAVGERTAAVIWKVLDQVESRIFLWNVFPLHPHEMDQPFTNRQHNAKERAAGEEILLALISLLKPSRIVAIGNDAASSAQRVTAVPIHCVRHPSYGGQTKFLRQMAELYGILDRQKQLI